jgi:alkylation response protein AidB-like acyl-CoA dehydrogenase
MLTLLAHGTDYQKEKFLKPLLNGEKRVCYSMTERAVGRGRRPACAPARSSRATASTC